MWMLVGCQLLNMGHVDRFYVLPTEEKWVLYVSFTNGKDVRLETHETEAAAYKQIDGIVNQLKTLLG